MAILYEVMGAQSSRMCCTSAGRDGHMSSTAAVAGVMDVLGTLSQHDPSHAAAQRAQAAGPLPVIKQ